MAHNEWLKRRIAASILAALDYELGRSHQPRPSDRREWRLRPMVGNIPSKGGAMARLECATCGTPARIESVSTGNGRARFKVIYVCECPVKFIDTKVVHMADDKTPTRRTEIKEF